MASTLTQAKRFIIALMAAAFLCVPQLAFAEEVPAEVLSGMDQSLDVSAASAGVAGNSDGSSSDAPETEVAKTEDNAVAEDANSNGDESDSDVIAGSDEVISVAPNVDTLDDSENEQPQTGQTESAVAETAVLEEGITKEQAQQVQTKDAVSGAMPSEEEVVTHAQAVNEDPAAGGAGSGTEPGEDPIPDPDPELDPIDINDVKAQAPGVVYTGKAQKPELSVTYAGAALVKGTDYVITSWKNNVKVGTASVVIAGKGLYTGTRTLTFKIVGKPSFTKGATKMPVASTTKWKLTNAKLKLLSGNSITFKGGTVTAQKAGASKLAVVNLLGQVVKSYTIDVYKLNGVYVLASCVGGGKVLDTAAASKDDGANLQLYSKNGTQAQAFKFKRSGDAYVIVNANSGKAVDVKWGWKSNGVNVQQWSSNGSDAQKWRITVDASNRLTFVNVNSGKVLDVAGASKKNGANVQQYRSNGSKAQKWKLLVAPVKYTFGASRMPVASTSKWSVVNGRLKVISGAAATISGKTVTGYQPGKCVVAVLNSVGDQVAKRTVTVYELNQYYTLNSALSKNMVVDVEGGFKDDGANVRLFARNGTMAQAFRFTRYGDAYIITNANSGRVLDVAGGLSGNGVNVRQWKSNGTGAQKWHIAVDKGNRLTFINVGTGKALDVLGAKAYSGSNVQQYKSNGTKAQKWTLTSVGPVYKAGNYLAAAAVALSGFGGKKSPTAPGYYTRPPDEGRGGNWTVYNKVYDAMSADLFKNRYTDCAGNVALAVKWSGIDDEYPADPWVNIQHAYLVSSGKWNQIGTGAYRLDEIQQKVALKPGDVLVHPNGDGTYSHIGIYTGTAANDLKYPGAGFDYVQAARGMKKWMYTLPLAKADYGWYTWEVFRRNESEVNVYSSKYVDVYPEEREKYLVNGW